MDGKGATEIVGIAFEAPWGLTRGGLPYNRLGNGQDILVVFQGLTFENAPMRGMEARFTQSMYSFLSKDYTVFVVNRRAGLQPGCTIGDMADDYARMIEEEFAGPVDVLGLSTGGAICQQFAADHSGLVRKLVIHSSAHKLGPRGKEVQLRARDFASEGQWRKCSAALMELFVPPVWYRSALLAIGGPLMALGAPKDGSDMVATVNAEDEFDFQDRLCQVRAPTLLVAGADDPFYTPELFQETANGIPDCELRLYTGMGHPAKGPQFERDVFAFLRG